MLTQLEEEATEIVTKQEQIEVVITHTYGSAQNEWSGGQIHKSRIGPQLPESAYTTCKSGGYLPVSGGQLALVMAEVTTTNHCGQNTTHR